MEFLQSLFSRIRNWVTGIWEKTEKRDRTRFLVIAGIALTLIVASIVVLNNGRYVKISEKDDPAAMSAATAVLSDNNIAYKTSGNAILVNKADQWDATGLLMNSDTGLEAIDYTSIYQMAVGLTNTEADRRAFAKAQAEDRLKRYFEAFPMVEYANVILNLPDNSSFLFASEMQQSTASVVVFFQEGYEPTTVQINTIVDIVSTAANIAPENITVSDRRMQKLNRNGETESIYETLNANYAFKRKLETDLENTLLRPLSLLYGSGNVGVTVSTRLNFDEHAIEKVTFEPVVDDEGIPRSVQVVDEYAKGYNYIDGEPGTDENGLGDDYSEVDSDLWNQYQKTQETTNYEIDQINESIIKEKGELEEITIAVIINSNGMEATDQNTEAVTALVGATVGLRPAQYEGNIQVSYMPMQGVVIADEQQAAYQAQLQRDKMFELIQTLVLYLIIGICAVLLIWRTFAFLRPKPVELPAVEYVVGDKDEYSALVEAAAQSMELEVTKTPSRERVEEFIESNPEAVANMLRTWLADEGERSW